MRKVKDESDLNKKALAVKEMSLHTLNLGTHISRFARIAWILDMLFIFLAILIFSVVLILGAAKDFIPPEIWQMLDSSLDVDFKGFLFFLLGLVAVPIVFDVILSVVCEHSSVTVEKTADGATAQASEKSGDMPDDGEEDLHYVRQALVNAQNELDPAYSVPSWISIALCALFLIPVGIAIFFSCMEMNTSTLSKLLVTTLSGIVLFLLFLGAFWLLVWLKLRVLALFFSSWKSRRRARNLLDEFIKDLRKYEKQQGAELYRRATTGSTVDESLMIRAAELGDPQAGLYMGRKILKGRVVFSDREIKDAKKYLGIAFVDIPDVVLWSAYARLKSGEWHDEDEWGEILKNIFSIDKAKLSSEGRDMYEDVVKQLIDKEKSAHVVVSASDVARRLGGGGSVSGFGSEWSSMNNDLDAARRAAGIAKEYGPCWRGYDAEAPIQDTEALGPDPESFPDSNDIW